MECKKTHGMNINKFLKHIALKNNRPINVTSHFVSLLMCSTCFGH